MEIKSASDFVKMARGALVAAGFTRHERDGAVWFENVGRASARPGRAEARPALVLIHGANDHAGTWFAVAPALARQYRVLIPDLAGHGESEPRTGPIPLSLIVAKLEALLHDEGELTVVGNSLGGWMALVYTLRNRERVSRLGLESSGGLNRPLAVPLVARTRGEAMTILRAVHGPAYEPREWVIEALLARASDSPMLRLTELPEHDVEPRLGEIDVPTTLITGADDGVVTRDYSEALRAAIPNASMCVIEGAAHIPHLQQPGRFLECLTSIS
ncbi:MAG TPA: alpha/beta hydrolase [Thermoanaerobaculia bacterium]|nr:alpha/beta hydrolase [Thermoanaerobaculia bacterium]